MSLLDTASLIVTPNGYKEGKLYSVIPSDGSGDMSVTRATTATRVNSAGLVELVPYNLNTNSENFVFGWGNDATSTPTNNFTTAPNGTMTAAKVVSNIANGYAYKSLPVPPGTYTLSYYIKASSATTISIGFNEPGLGVFGQVFNVTTEWQRFSFTYNVVGNNLYLDYSKLQLGVDYYIWGAQLVEGSTAKDYQKTETRLNIPRLDYSNGTCPSLLVEPQRTNNFQYSSQFDNAYWSKVAATVTANNIASPSGIQDADKVEFNSGYINGTSTVADNQTYTISFFAKKGTADTLLINEAFYVGTSTTFNLTSGTVTSGTGTIESYGNDWYRCSVQFTYGVGQVVASWLIRNYQAGYIYVWGAQLEAGSYSTSFIPTTSASVTRNADVVSKTGISSLIGQTEGSFFCEFNYNGVIDNSTARKIISLNDGTSDNLVDAYFVATATTIQARVRAGAVGFGSITSGALSSGNYKIAYAYKNSDFVLYINGTQIGSVSSGTISFSSPVSIVQIGDGEAASDQLGGGIKAASLWKTRLTNTQLAALTTI